jgi:hypothetical protein
MSAESSFSHLGHEPGGSTLATIVAFLRRLFRVG